MRVSELGTWLAKMTIGESLYEVIHFSNKYENYVIEFYKSTDQAMAMENVCRLYV